MNRIISGLLATTLSASFVAAEIVPVNAAAELCAAGTRALLGRADRAVPGVAETPDFNRNRTFSRNDGMYWNGHRGYREYRRGYRRHGDFWFPLAAFATGALITGAIINNQNRVYRSGDAHVQWCYDRYRSYRAWDNTFQPYDGPRQQCYSPY